LHGFSYKVTAKKLGVVEINVNLAQIHFNAEKSTDNKSVGKDAW
jgi:hypothetical protein